MPGGRRAREAGSKAARVKRSRLYAPDDLNRAIDGFNIRKRMRVRKKSKDRYVFVCIGHP